MNRNKTQLLPFNSLQLAAQCKARSLGLPTGQKQLGILGLLSLSVQLAHVTSPTPLLSSAALPEEQIIIPTSGLCRDGVKASVEALGQAWIGPGPTPCFLPQHHSIKENAQTLETAGNWPNKIDTCR